MNVFFVTSEYHPFAKAGGLADAVAALAQALADKGHRLTVVLPRYRSIDDANLRRLAMPLGVPMGRREEWCDVFHTVHNGVELYFLEHLALFGERNGLYGGGPASAFHDNARRFAFLSRGALQLALALRITPDIIHAHDWPTALVPVYVDQIYRPRGFFRDTGMVFSIHNFGYQGIFAGRDGEEIGLTEKQLGESDLRQGEDINMMRGAIRHSDRLVAVSPRYAQEIQQPRFGFGLHLEIQRHTERVSGILNGIDIDEWNPETDARIPERFSADDLSGKAVCKEALQRELGLPVDSRVPLVGMITRLVDQKGIIPLFDRRHGAIRTLLDELPVQIALLGSGERWCEREIEVLRDTYPTMAARIGYDADLAHRIEAGSDFFLMPSVYEPCGLNQMYSMRYGTLPIVTRTGGLADTVDVETGFFIEDNSSEGIVRTVTKAAQRLGEIETMRRRAMGRDFSWRHSAEEYEALYRSAR